MGKYHRTTQGLQVFLSAVDLHHIGGAIALLSPWARGTVHLLRRVFGHGSSKPVLTEQDKNAFTNCATSLTAFLSTTGESDALG